MKYSTKFWLFILLMVVVKFFVWIFTGEMTQEKEQILVILTIFYVIFCLREAACRVEEDDLLFEGSKYFNLLWYPARGIVLLNKFLDKLQEYDEREK